MSNYEKFKGNNNLVSFVKRDPFKIMEHLFGDKYLAYRTAWMNASGSQNTQFFDFPIHIDIDLKDACNQNCAMCHQKYRSRSNAIMTWNLLKKIIDEGARNNLCAVNFGSSAEPLLCKELLMQGINYANSKGIMDIFLHTNAVFLDRQTSQELIESGLRHICISIDAATAKTYKKSRNSDFYEKIIKNIEIFIETREKLHSVFPTLRVSFCINPTNYEEKNMFIRLWQEKADLVEFQNFRHVHGTPDIGMEFENIKATCSNPFKRVMIWPEGDMSLCCGYRSSDVTLGNVLDSDIISLWHSDKMNNIRESFRMNERLPKICTKCLASNYKLKNC